MKIIALVGMSGSGKSEVARMLRERGLLSVRFGDVTDAAVKKRGLPLNEASERRVREELRAEHGMAAYARLNLPRIDAALEKADAVILDGLYSWEEYALLRERYGDSLVVVAVWSAPATRYARLGSRQVRPLTPEEAAARDRAEIENINKGGPIAMADYTVSNEASLADLQAQVERVIAQLL